MALQWNGEHKLVKATTTRQSHTDAQMTQTVTYGYNPFGRRLYKKDAFGITHFVWDGNRLLEEVRGSHARTYVYQAESFVPVGASQGNCRLVHAANGCLSMRFRYALTTASRSGLSVTAPMGVQLRVLPDQRRGLRSRAWQYNA